MGWRGTLRIIAAAQRRIEQEERRRLRENEKNYKLQLKLEEAESSAFEVECFEEKIQQITSIHRVAGEEVPWEQLLKTPNPTAPARSNLKEQRALIKLNNYKPGFFDKLFRNDKKAAALLEAAVEDARKADEQDFAASWSAYTSKLAEAEQSRSLANAVLGGDLEAYLDAVSDISPLAEMQDMGCDAEIRFPDRYRAEVLLQVESSDVIPPETVSLTKSGKLSRKKMPERQFHELYQDYVCGCALRAARELFSLLPLNLVVVNVQTDLLDPSTGHIIPQTILSVAIPKITLSRVNFHSVDASDSMKLFVHRMGFKKSEGFYAIQQLLLSEYPTG